MSESIFNFSQSIVPGIIAETSATIRQRLHEIATLRQGIKQGLPLVLGYAEMGDAAASQAEVDKLAALHGRIGVARSSLIRLSEEMDLFCLAAGTLKADPELEYAREARRLRSEMEETEATSQEAGRIVAAARLLRERLLAQMPT